MAEQRAIKSSAAINGHEHSQKTWHCPFRKSFFKALSLFELAHRNSFIDRFNRFDRSSCIVG